MNNKAVFIKVRFQKDQDYPILIDVFEQLQNISVINLDFILEVLSSEFDIDRNNTVVKFLSKSLNIYTVIDEDFKMSPMILKEKGLSIFVTQKRAMVDDLTKQLKYEMQRMCTDIKVLKETLNDKFIFYDCLLFGNSAGNPDSEEFFKSFYSDREMKKLNDKLNREKSTSTNEMSEYGTSYDKLQLNHIPSTFSTDTRFDYEEGTLDFGILYSEPLVKYDRSNAEISERPQNSLKAQPSVDFESECNMVLDIVKELNSNISLVIKCLTTDALLKLINTRPKILYIICNVETEAASERYFLQCENHRAEVLSLSLPKLKDLLGHNENIGSIKLVVINANEPGNLAKLFLELGAECVVSIQKGSRLADHILKEFTSDLFTSLLNGSEMGESFKKASQTVLATCSGLESALQTCVNAHTHKQSCIWHTLVRELGAQIAQLEQPPKSPHGNYSEFYEISKKTDNNWAKKMIFRFVTKETDILYKKIENEWVICCCSPETAHAETIKFQIMFKDGFKDFAKSVIFPKNVTREINKQSLQAEYFAGKQFLLDKSTGFNVYLYKLFKYFVHEEGKVALIKGVRGSGKTTLAKHFASYCKERKKFDYAKVFELEGETSFSSFDQKITRYLDSERLHLKYRSNRSGNVSFRKILLILDDLDELINKDINIVIKTMQKYIENHNIHFIMTVSDINKAYGFYFSEKMIIQKIEPLPLESSAKIFLRYCEDQLQTYFYDFDVLARNEKFKEYFKAVEGYPKHVTDLAALVHKNSNINEVLTKCVNLDASPTKHPKKQAFNDTIRLKTN